MVKPSLTHGNGQAVLSSGAVGGEEWQCVCCRVSEEVHSERDACIYDPSGQLYVFGARTPGPTVTARIHDRSLQWKLFVNPELYAAEAYMDGTLTFEDGSTVRDFILLFSLNRSGLAGLRVAESAAQGLARSAALASSKSDRQSREECARTTTTFRPTSTGSSSTRTCSIRVRIFAIPEQETLEQAQRNKLDSRHQRSCGSSPG